MTADDNRAFEKGGKLARVCAIASVAALVLSLIPMLLLTRYDYPAWDDFSFGAESRAALAAGEGVVSQAVESSREHFKAGIGNLIAFFHALMPDIWSTGVGVNTYSWGAAAYILLFTTSAFIFAFQICRKLLDSERYRAVAAASFFSLICVQFLPCGVEGFYSYINATAYTLPMSLQMLTGALAVTLCAKARGSFKSDAARCALAFAAAFVAGMLTYLAPGLTVALLWASLIVWAFTAKFKSRYIVLCAGSGALAAFFATLFSGGAQARAAEQLVDPNPVGAVFNSILFSTLYAGRWLCAPILILAGFIVAALWPAIAKSRFSFKYPLVAAALAFGLYCSVGVPVVYARGGRGSGRIFNIEFWFFIIALLFSLVWLAGWFIKRYPDGISLSKGVRALKTPLVIALCVLLALSCLQLDNFDIFNPELPMNVEQRVTSLSAAWSLASGEAARYAAERDERLAVLLDKSVSDAVFEPIETRPYLLFYRDLDYGAVAPYYGKNSVTVAPETSSDSAA